MKVYNIPEDLFEEVLEVLRDNMFYIQSDGEYCEEYNNDEVIEVVDKLRDLKKKQDADT